MSTFFVISRRRILACLRQQCPLVFLLVPFIIGQICGYQLYVLYESNRDGLCVALLLVLSSLFYLIFRYAVYWVIAGIVAIFCALYSPPSSIDSSASQQLLLVSEPRFPAPGRIEGIFRILGGEGRGAEHYARCRAVALPWKNIVTIAPGDSIIVRAVFVPISLPSNPFSYDATERRHGIRYRCKILLSTRGFSTESYSLSRARLHLYQRVTERFGTREISGLFLSMVLGYRDQLSAATERAFQSTGLTHLLVVSGFHVTLIFSAVLFLIATAARRILRTQPDILLCALLIACATALSFVAFVGVDGASLRAALAVLIVVLGRVLERGGGMVRNIISAFFALIIIWPGCFYEPGTQLTFAALLGIAYGMGLRTKSKLLKYCVIAIAPSLMTLGVSVLWFEMLSLAGFVLNPLCAGLVSFVVTIGGLTGLVFFLLSIDSSALIISTLLVILEYFRDFVVLCARIPFAAIELDGFWKIVCGVVILAICALLWLERSLRFAIGQGIISVRSGRILGDRLKG